MSQVSTQQGFPGGFRGRRAAGAAVVSGGAGVGVGGEDDEPPQRGRRVTVEIEDETGTLSVGAVGWLREFAERAVGVAVRGFSTLHGERTGKGTCPCHPDAGVKANVEGVRPLPGPPPEGEGEGGRRDEGAARDEVRVRVVGDARMSELHLRHAGVEGTTDVLTFDLRDSAGGTPAPLRSVRPLDVDIVVCVDEARRQAAARGHAVERELLLYVLHGALHCLGYDDHSGEDSARMHAREDEILEAVGVGAVFAREEACPHPAAAPPPSPRGRRGDG